MNTTTIVTCLVVGGMVTTAAQADIIHVDIANCPGPGDGSVGNPYCSIQTAIIAAVTGDEVVVAPGTYNEAFFFNGFHITVRSSDGPEVTILDGAGLPTYIVRCILGEMAVLEGFTITGSTAARAMWIKGTGSPGLAVNECIFAQNPAGAILIENVFSLITDCVFVDNSGMNGGAIHFIGNPHSDIVNCEFIGNNASNGGAIYRRDEGGSTTTVTNCLFAQNTAALQGHAVHVRLMKFVNCTFTAHPGTVFFFSSIVQIQNSIIWGNLGAFFEGAFPNVTESDIEGGWPGIGNIMADPLFVDPDNQNYRLTVGSPCINAGNYAFNDSLLDLDGNPRFIDDDGVKDPEVDMGPYEFQGEVTVRCCFNDESCQDITELLCTQTGGQPGQPGSSCLDGPCPPPPPCPTDLNGDGETGIVDFLELLANWGTCP